MTATSPHPYELDDVQLQFQSILRKFLDQTCSDSALRRLLDSDLGYDPVVWRRLATELDVLGLLIPERFGGSGLGPLDLVTAMEEMGRSLFCGPYLASSVLGTAVLLAAADEDAGQRILPGIAAGESIATVAYQESSAGWVPRMVATAAHRSSQGWSLHGEKLFVLNADAADVILVLARTPDGPSLFSVDPGAGGVESIAMPVLDRTRRMSRLVFSGGPGRLIGTPGAGLQSLDEALRISALALAAEQLGGAQRMLDSAVEHAKQRVQFGRPIGSFQAVKQRCAEMLLAVESARSAVCHGARSLADGSASAATSTGIAKSVCSEAFVQVARDCIHIHGGIGFTWEHPAHLYLRRAKSSEVLFGTPSHHREVIVRHLL